ncbi:MAG: hypothetical protein ACK2UK_19190, partial [Candidatus Promineifilaceae bacterium]
EQLEQVFHLAESSGETSDFRQAIEESYAAQPDNLLYGAWAARLRYAAAYTQTHARQWAINWAWAVPLALLNGLLFWWLSNERYMVEIVGFQGRRDDFVPLLILLAAPMASVFVLAYLAAAGKRKWSVAALCALLALAAAGYVLLFYPQLGTMPFQQQYVGLMIAHLPLVAWAAVGFYLTAGHRDAANRFAFLISSLQVFVVGGLFAIAGAIFMGITIALFEALGIQMPEPVLLLFLAGGLGVLSVLVVAVVYNPSVSPAEQPFDEGLGRLISLLPRILLPLTLLVLVIYLVFVAFNFRAPFDNRDVLITYNAMLFAVVALLVGATPLNKTAVTYRQAPWLRRGIIAVAALALLVGIYALVAIAFRSYYDRLTPNRLTFIGWNVVNIALLAFLLWRQARAAQGSWIEELHRAFGAGTVAYTAWALAVILVMPWLFGFDQGAVGQLPLTVQRIIYNVPDPVLLKCTASDPIYLLEDGEKRWIESIETFEESGYRWSDVQFVSCDDLRTVPDGVPIPPGAGPPPQP